MKKSLKPHWQYYDSNLKIPKGLCPWILHSGSFMERLKEKGVKTATIQVLQNTWQLPDAEEREKLGIPPRQYALVREVFIRGDNKLLMYARTVIPLHTIKKHKLLAHLKTRSLGSVLFKDPNLQRSPFEIACLLPNTKWQEKLKSHCKLKKSKLWARRSIFNSRGADVLLMEVFFQKLLNIA